MSEKKGASTSPGALTKLCTAVNKFKGDGFVNARSNNPASRVSSILQRFCTAGFHAEGLPQGILLASLITLHKSGEITSKVGTSVKEGTDAREVGAGVRKGIKGSSGASGGTEGDEEEKEEDERTEAEEKRDEEEKEEDEQEDGDAGEEQCNKNASKREIGPVVATELNDTPLLFSNRLKELGVSPQLLSCDDKDKSKVV